MRQSQITNPQSPIHNSEDPALAAIPPGDDSTSPLRLYIKKLEEEGRLGLSETSANVVQTPKTPVRSFLRRLLGA